MSKNRGAIKGIIFFIIGINIFIGLGKGLLNLILGKPFLDGFFEQTGWMLPMVMLIILFIVILLFFEGKNHNKTNY